MLFSDTITVVFQVFCCNSVCTSACMPLSFLVIECCEPCSCSASPLIRQISDRSLTISFVMYLRFLLGHESTTDPPISLFWMILISDTDSHDAALRAKLDAFKIEIQINLVLVCVYDTQLSENGFRILTRENS